MKNDSRPDSPLPEGFLDGVIVQQDPYLLPDKGCGTRGILVRGKHLVRRRRYRGESRRCNEGRKGQPERDLVRVIP